MGRGCSRFTPALAQKEKERERNHENNADIEEDVRKRQQHGLSRNDAIDRLECLLPRADAVSAVVAKGSSEQAQTMKRCRIVNIDALNQKGSVNRFIVG